MTAKYQFKPGDKIIAEQLKDINGCRISLLPERGLTHLQFRRFAGCPICNLHLQSFNRRYVELKSLSIQEVVLFHSDIEQLQKYAHDFPFPIVADPKREYYRKFSVESSPYALSSLSVIGGIIRGVFYTLYQVIFFGKKYHP